MPGLCDVSSKFYTISYRFTVYLLCHKKRSLIRSKRNEQGSKQTYLILLFSAPILTQHEHRSTSPVTVDFAFRQGEARREYFVYLRELQRCLGGKARHPWLWILRSGKTKLDGNTLCISKGFNAARTQKRVTRGCGFCVQARQTPMGILCVSPRASTQYQHKRRVTRDCGFFVQARRSSTGILFVFPRGLTMPERKSASPVAMDFAFRQNKPRREYSVYF